MKNKGQHTAETEMLALFALRRCSGSLAKPTPFAMGFLAGYAGSNPATASIERGIYATTMKEKT